MDSSEEHTKNLIGISYLVIVPVVVIVIIIIASLGSYYYRAMTAFLPFRHRSADPQGNLLAIGLDETTLQSYPTLLYSQAKLDHKESTPCCSICLSDYNNTDMLRLLPECGHLFHVECVDPWFQLHTTCPVCRSTPMSQIVLQT
ncbi:RING-type E3 ubiquitin transferase [Ranunculus cassubicifolius]